MVLLYMHGGSKQHDYTNFSYVTPSSESLAHSSENPLDTNIPILIMNSEQEGNNVMQLKMVKT